MPPPASSGFFLPDIPSIFVEIVAFLYEFFYSGIQL
jgi:hypothetical protein